MPITTASITTVPFPTASFTTESVTTAPITTAPDRPELCGPTRTQRHWVGALAMLATLVIVAAACGGDDDAVQTEEPSPTAVSNGDDTTASEDDDGSGDDGDTVSTGDPEPTATDVAAPTPAPEATAVPDAPPESAGVLAALFTGGGFTPVDVALASFPQLVIYTDGTVYRPTQDLGFPVPLTAPLERLQLTPEQVTSIEALLAASPVLGDEADFGSPNLADAPSTTLSTFTDRARIVSVYALGLDDDLGETANESRAQFAALLDDIAAVVDEAAAGAQPALPPAAAVLSFPGLAVQEDAPVRDWPIGALPEPVAGGTACVIVTGDELATLWEAAGDATTATPWRIDGQVTAVAVRPVYPHEDVC